jgi:hypothetical protein
MMKRKVSRKVPRVKNTLGDDGWPILDRISRLEDLFKRIESVLKQPDHFIHWSEFHTRFDELAGKLKELNRSPSWPEFNTALDEFGRRITNFQAFEDESIVFQRKVKEEGLLIHERITAVTKELNQAKSEWHLATVSAARTQKLRDRWNMLLWGRWFGLRTAA